PGRPRQRHQDPAGARLPGRHPGRQPGPRRGDRAVPGTPAGAGAHPGPEKSEAAGVLSGGPRDGDSTHATPQGSQAPPPDLRRGASVPRARGVPDLLDADPPLQAGPRPLPDGELSVLVQPGADAPELQDPLLPDELRQLDL